jgi:hypothetical protein
MGIHKETENDALPIVAGKDNLTWNEMVAESGHYMTVTRQSSHFIVIRTQLRSIQKTPIVLWFNEEGRLEAADKTWKHSGQRYCKVDSDQVQFNLFIGSLPFFPKFKQTKLSQQFQQPF